MLSNSWPFAVPERGPDRPLDVIVLGHALVDRLAFVEPATVTAAGLDIGVMTLVDAARAVELHRASPEWRQVAGGSAANTAAGVASLGGCPGFAGAVGADEPGEWYSGDMEAAGVECHVDTVASGNPTGVCHVFVTGDGDRSMATSLGAAGELALTTLTAASLARAQVLYVEGYLLDAAPATQDALAGAIAVAKAHGMLLALSLSDPFVVERHHDRIAGLVFGGPVDVLLGNEDEAMALTGADSIEGAVKALTQDGKVAVITRGSSGALAVLPDGQVAVSATPVPHVADTTGAGDLFAAGFLYGLTRGTTPEHALGIGAFAAGEIIGHLGARPVVRLSEAAPAKLLDGIS